MTGPSQANAPSTLKLYLWILVLSESVSQLDRSCATLVEAILHVDWAFREAKFADAYVAFLQNLVSAHAFYVVPVMHAFVKGFRYREVVPAYATVSRSDVYLRNHAALQAILKLIPMSAKSLVDVISMYIPKERESSACHAAYISNALQVTNYVTYLRKQIMELIVTHMIHFDAHIQIELDELEDEVELQELTLDFDADYASDDSDDEDESDEEGNDDADDSYAPDDDDSDAETEKKVSEDKRKLKIESMTRKLDGMMLLLLRYLSNLASDDKATRSEREDMFNTLLSIFDSTVVKTLKARYTQFLVFYYCSIDVSTYPEVFLNHLLDHMRDPSRPGITRISCAMYIASYVARASFLDVSSIQRAVNVLSIWCNEYADHHEFPDTQPDASKYDTFYAAMQAIMYIFCFRWRELVVEDGLDDLVETEEVQESVLLDTTPMITIGNAGDVTRNWCVGLKNLPRLISSRLNPLKVCSQLVVNQFAHVARTTNFLYVHPIIQKNKRIVIAGMGHTNLQAVQSFFPFDPYKLKTSSHFIENIYSVWRGDNDDESSDESSDEEDSSDDEEDERVTNSMSAMSISPSPHMLV
ncbi:RNA polymerase I-specific transcription initiation factor RRN3 [Fennellomyces sp. T-0311]|nr:RNA polymerase I-specific transcription initiation factor RRN3 [Fennellomyces sp. T-0311]